MRASARRSLGERHGSSGDSEHESLGLTHALTFLTGGSGRGGACAPPLPQIRTCGFPASGSSCHGLADLVANTLCTTRGGGRGWWDSRRSKRGKLM